jgi:hypothetical protein
LDCDLTTSAFTGTEQPPLVAFAPKRDTN